MRRKGRRVRAYVNTPVGRATRLWHSARTRAARQGVPFTIDRDWVAARIAAGSCEATGLAFDLTPASERATHPFTPTLDRQDPEQGYTPENTRVVVWAYNAARGAWGDDVLLLIAQNLTEQLKGATRR